MTDPIDYQQLLAEERRSAERSAKKRRWIVGGVIALVVGGTIVGAALTPTDHDKAVDECVKEATANGATEADGKTFCEAAVTKDEAAQEQAEAADADEAEANAPEEESSTPKGVVPDLVGYDLQTAQDTLQEAGYKHIESVDDTGRGRHQMNDSNWIVVDQTPSAGTKKPTSYVIYLFVVKDGEA